MNEQDVASWADIIQTLVVVVVIPLAGLFVQKMSARFDKDGQFTQWTEGAAAAAGRIALKVELRRRMDPTADLKKIIDLELRSEAQQLLASYGPAVPRLEPTLAAATSRIDGELGKLISAGSDIVKDAATRITNGGALR